jgi:hypothetical protein
MVQLLDGFPVGVGIFLGRGGIERVRGPVPELANAPVTGIKPGELVKQSRTGPDS